MSSLAMMTGTHLRMRALGKSSLSLAMTLKTRLPMEAKT